MNNTWSVFQSHPFHLVSPSPWPLKLKMIHKRNFTASPSRKDPSLAVMYTCAPSLALDPLFLTFTCLIGLGSIAAVVLGGQPTYSSWIGVLHSLVAINQLLFDLEQWFIAFLEQNEAIEDFNAVVLHLKGCMALLSNIYVKLQVSIRGGPFISILRITSPFLIAAIENQMIILEQRIRNIFGICDYLGIDTTVYYACLGWRPGVGTIPI